VIEARIKAKGGVRAPSVEEVAMPKNASTNVVDFMSLLQKSIDNKQRTPAKKSAPGARSGSRSNTARPKATRRKRGRKKS
jgi:DNA end-binding protein Ku